MALVEHPQWLPSHYVMNLEVEKVINDGFIECELSAEVPKQEAPFFEASMRLHVVAQADGTLSVEVDSCSWKTDDP